MLPLRQRVTTHVRPQAQTWRAAEERKRLARGVVTGPIPGDLAREEHDRIAHELEASRDDPRRSPNDLCAHRGRLKTRPGLVGSCDEDFHSAMARSATNARA